MGNPLAAEEDGWLTDAFMHVSMFLAGLTLDGHLPFQTAISSVCSSNMKSQLSLVLKLLR